MVTVGPELVDLMDRILVVVLVEPTVVAVPTHLHGHIQLHHRWTLWSIPVIIARPVWWIPPSLLLAGIPGIHNIPAIEDDTNYHFPPLRNRKSHQYQSAMNVSNCHKNKY